MIVYLGVDENEDEVMFFRKAKRSISTFCGKTCGYWNIDFNQGLLLEKGTIKEILGYPINWDDVLHRTHIGLQQLKTVLHEATCNKRGKF